MFHLRNSEFVCVVVKIIMPSTTLLVHLQTCRPVCCSLDRVCQYHM